MKGIFRRPLALTAGVFLLTLFLAVRYSAMGGALPALLICGGALLLAVGLVLAGIFSPSHRRRLRTVFFYTSAIALSLSLAFFTAWRIDPLHTARVLLPLEGETVKGILTVEEIDSQTDYSTALTVSLTTADGSQTNLRGRIHLPYSADLQKGDEISLTFVLRLLRTDGKLADSYDLSQGIFFEAEAIEDEYTLLSRHSDSTETWLDDLKLTLKRQFYPYLSYDDVGLACALLLGDKSTLSSDLQNQFQNLGISHTLAVSGLHLGILFCSLVWLFRKFGLPRWLHLPILLPLLLIYCIMVGSPSVLRAGTMLLFLFAAYYFGRLQDSVTSLFVAVSAICLLSPYSILDVGLLLSFFATWGILLIVPVCAEKLRAIPKFPRWVLSALTVTLSATLFTLPLTVFYFGNWAVLSFAANLLIVPIITILLYLLPILFVLSPIPILAYTPAKLIGLIMGWLGNIASNFGSDDRLLLPLNYPAIETAALLLLAITLLLCLFRKTRPLTLAALVIFLSFAGGYDHLHAKELLQSADVYPLTDGENDCLLLRYGTRVMLIDRSKGGYAFLEDAVAQGESDPLIRLDTILLTHYHYRQIASLTRLLDSGRIEYLILPSPTETDKNTAEVLMERAKANGCKVEIYSPEQSCIGYHGYEIRLEYYPDDALRSISIGIGDQQILYTEDLLESTAPMQIPAHFGNDIEGIDRAWNRLYEFAPLPDYDA